MAIRSSYIVRIRGYRGVNYNLIGVAIIIRKPSRIYIPINIYGKAYARGSGGSTCCGECGPALLSGLADQHLVGNLGDAAPMPRRVSKAACRVRRPIEAEHELIEVVLQVCPSQAVVNAQAPALEV